MTKVHSHYTGNDYRGHTTYTVTSNEIETVVKVELLRKWSVTRAKYYQEQGYEIVKTEDSGDQWRPFKVTMRMTRNKVYKFDKWAAAAQFAKMIEGE